MDVGAVNGIRAAVPTAAAPEGELERRPILAARTGPAPLSAFVGRPLAENLVGDAEIAASGVRGVRNLHARKS